jgi:hypothetical protein
LADLSQRLEQWRSQQSGRQKLPSEFWSEAAALARHHGTTRVANVLRMNASVLRSKSERRPNKPRNTSAAFVEVSMPPILDSECTLEVETARGKLRLQLRRMPVAAIAELVRSLGA